MMEKLHRASFEAMGTTWAITVWDQCDEDVFTTLIATITAKAHAFDQAYSRFIPSSLIHALSRERGIIEVPEDLVTMLRMYEELFSLSQGLLNPLVGFALCDLGYDEIYTLVPRSVIRPVPAMPDALRIIDATHIELLQSVLIDLGALGKGFFVDRISEMLQRQGYKRYLVDGSGDMLYRSGGEPIRAGLEHPNDPKKVIGVVTMTEGSMCSSANNRRRWGEYHHTIHPLTLTSPKDILATWVTADTAALADGLATCLFLAPPEQFREALSFEYCILHADMHVTFSSDFGAELF